MCLAWSETPEDTFSHGVAQIHFCVNLFTESVALEMTVVVVLWFNVQVNNYGHAETVI